MEGGRWKIQGFTLIELLVVISIIGVLAAMITVSFVNSQRQARDTQRKSDLSQYRSALESFAGKSTGGVYPVNLVATNITTLCSATVLNVATCPVDPKSTQNYQYCSDNGGINYALWASLENMTSTYWIVCSSGKSGTSTSAPSGCGTADFNCNLP